MEKIKIKDYKIKKTKIFTREQELANQIYFYFNKKLKFSMIMKFIKTKGCQAIFEAWQEVKNSDPINRESLFLWKIAQNKIQYRVSE